MIQLSDTQLVILSTASAHADGNVLPISKTVKAKGKSLDRVLTRLLKLALIEEHPVDHKAPSWRRDEIEGTIGLHITDAGRNAIGSDSASARSAEPGPPAPTHVKQVIKPGTKNAMLVILMRRRKGASIAELTEATGWLPHTCRAALTRLRHKGIVIERVTVAKGGSVYCVSSDNAGSA